MNPNQLNALMLSNLFLNFAFNALNIRILDFSPCFAVSEISNKGLKIYIYLDYKGYYAILEVSERANYQEIRRAYRNLARKYHPDRNNSSFAEDMIKKINAAFETLSDEQNRKQYDEMNYY